MLSWFLCFYEAAIKMLPNGTAIGAVCVTGEAIRLVVPVVSNGRVPVASRYGAVFAPSRAVVLGAIAVDDERV
jgi:hypothetical protein